VQEDHTFAGEGRLDDATGRRTGAGTPGATLPGEDRGDLEQLRDRADQALEAAADTLEHAARKVGAMAELLPGHGLAARAGTLGHGAADALESVAAFLRDNDIETLQHDLGRLVARRPLTVLLLAVGAGFVAGKALR
jgi:hypothetical protein